MQLPDLGLSNGLTRLLSALAAIRAVSEVWARRVCSDATNCTRAKVAITLVFVVGDVIQKKPEFSHVPNNKHQHTRKGGYYMMYQAWPGHSPPLWPSGWRTGQQQPSPQQSNVA